MRAAEERVRLKKEGGRYHHGNLTDALVLAAERSIAKSGSIDLPLRDVAKLAGVSHAAAYRHFESILKNGPSRVDHANLRGRDH